MLFLKCVVYSRFSGTLFPVSMIDGVYGSFVSAIHVRYNNRKCRPLAYGDFTREIYVRYNNILVFQKYWVLIESEMPL